MTKKIFLACILVINSYFSAFALDAWIRINQLGYTPDGIKKAVLVSESALDFKKFSIHDALTNEKLAEYNTFFNYGKYEPFTDVYILDFSSFKAQGAFYLKAGYFFSPTIYINKNIYQRSADFLLQYMRSARCGADKNGAEACHTEEAFEMYGPDIYVPVIPPAPVETSKTNNKKNQKKAVQPEPELVKITKFIDVSGGWHDAPYYSKNSSTAATSVYQMLFAWQMHPDAFGDAYDEKGQKGANGLPDILDEALRGIRWLMKMNPAKDTLYHQVGDNRFGPATDLPHNDIADYGQGKAHPVMLATGKPQGNREFQNRSWGVASLAGKMSAAFALGAEVLGKYHFALADTLSAKAIELYTLGKSQPGVCQEAPGSSVPFIAEDNWADDMELAAYQLYFQTLEPEYLQDAMKFGRMEPVSPWVFTDTAAHYQWFPFINIGHIMLGNMEKPEIKNEFRENIKATLQRADLKRQQSPFQVATPTVINSNNYVVALATQCQLYRKFTGDQTFIELETALIDWLFGCNPWGISMVVGLPETAKSPENAFSSQNRLNGEKPLGALINGPVSQGTFDKYKPENIEGKDNFERFQSARCVYHDDINDYISNAPTLDGTASLMSLLAAKQTESGGLLNDYNEYHSGAITRTNPQKKQITLVFSGHQYLDGKSKIARILKKQKVKASFFLTGDFLKSRRHKKFIKKLQKSGHYIGAHSDKHLIYTDPQNPTQLRVNKTQFMNDLRANFKALDKKDIGKPEAPFFMAPHGMVNDSINRWAHEAGLIMIGNTTGSNSEKDQSVPEMRDGYFSSSEIFNRILEVESHGGLNGYIMLFHTGSDKRRTDKFYKRLDPLIRELKKRGYSFTDLYESTGITERNTVDKNKKRKH